MTRSSSRSSPALAPSKPLHFAVVGAGMAGIACARTLVQAGHQVTVFEQNPDAGGRMATRDTPFGSFDHGAQYFTVRDPRFEQALLTAPGISKPWSASTVRVLDTLGRVAAAGPAAREAHWVPTPGMDTLVRHWAHPLAASTELATQVTRIERDALNPRQWQLRTHGSLDAPEAQRVFPGFDSVLLATPLQPTIALLHASKLATGMLKPIRKVQVAPCWTLLLAFPQANPGGIGPQWNAARSTHHRVAWLARESSKPGRSTVERWTVQASAAWSQEHLQDSAPRIQAKLRKAFAEITGIRAEPSYSEVHRWHDAQTLSPLGKTHLWDTASRIGVCGDWCIGHRVEDAFISGLELALTVA